MPELPEVETVRQGLNRLTLGTTIQGGEVLLGSYSRLSFISCGVFD